MLVVCVFIAGNHIATGCRCVPSVCTSSFVPSTVLSVLFCGLTGFAGVLGDGRTAVMPSRQAGLPEQIAPLIGMPLHSISRHYKGLPNPSAIQLYSVHRYFLAITWSGPVLSYKSSSEYHIRVYCSSTVERVIGAHDRVRYSRCSESGRCGDLVGDLETL